MIDTIDINNYERKEAKRTLATQYREKNQQLMAADYMDKFFFCVLKSMKRGIDKKHRFFGYGLSKVF